LILLVGMATCRLQTFSNLAFVMNVFDREASKKLNAIEETQTSAIAKTTEKISFRVLYNSLAENKYSSYNFTKGKVVIP